MEKDEDSSGARKEMGSPGQSHETGLEFVSVRVTQYSMQAHRMKTLLEVSLATVKQASCWISTDWIIVKKKKKNVSGS